MIPMSSPDITNWERAAVMDVLHTSRLSMGPQLEEFEQTVAEYVGTAYAAGVNSGTAGLHLAMIAAGISEWDCVVTSPLSFVATANCIRYVGADIVFVDVDPVTGNINPDLVAETVHDLAENGDKPAAILPVHICGQPADMDPIVKIGREWGIPVIEDACEALGSEYKGRRAGRLGDAAVFGFYPNKQITAGEGGMVVTRHAEWDALYRSLRNQGRDDPSAWLEHERLGYNYRMDEMSAALGLAQMGRIDELLSKREKVARWYNERLEGVEQVQRPVIVETTTRMSWFIYTVRVLPPASRDTVKRDLAESGIPSRTYFAPIHLQRLYRQSGYKRGMYPVAEAIGDQILALPFSSVMTEGQVDEVCETLMGVLRV